MSSPGPYLTAAQRNESCALLRLHMSAYQFLSKRAQTNSVLLYRMRPKTHYTVHLLQWVWQTGQNPQQQSCFLDEDHTKGLAGIAAALHPRTFNVEFGRRYSLKRVLAFDPKRLQQQKKRIKVHRR